MPREKRRKSSIRDLIPEMPVSRHCVLSLRWSWLDSHPIGSLTNWNLPVGSKNVRRCWSSSLTWS